MEPKGVTGSEDFAAGGAEIFKTLYVFLNVFFHVAYPIRFEVTLNANKPIKAFFNH